MQASPSARAAALAALLAVLPSLSLAEVCRPSSSAASGVCEEVRQEAGSSLELLQHRADRAQPEKAAGEKLAAKQDAQQAAKQDAKQGAKQEAGTAKTMAPTLIIAAGTIAIEASKAKDSQVPGMPPAVIASIAKARGRMAGFNPLGNPSQAAKIGMEYGGDPLREAVDTAALASITSVINSTIIMLSDQALKLRRYCTEYRDDLMNSVKAASDNKLGTLQSMVNTTLDPLVDRWSAISEALSAAGPPLDNAMKTFSLRPPWQEGVKYLARNITARVSSMHSSVARLASANRTSERDDMLLLLNETAQAGMSDVNAFGRSVSTFLQGVVTQVGQKLQVDLSVGRPADRANAEIYDTLQALMQGSADLASMLEEDLDILFNATYEAADEAASSAATGFWRHGVIAVAAACVGAHWL